MLHPRHMFDDFCFMLNRTPRIPPSFDTKRQPQVGHGIFQLFGLGRYFPLVQRLFQLLRDDVICQLVQLSGTDGKP